MLSMSSTTIFPPTSTTTSTVLVVPVVLATLVSPLPSSTVATVVSSVSSWSFSRRPTRRFLPSLRPLPASHPTVVVVVAVVLVVEAVAAVPTVTSASSAAVVVAAAASAAAAVVSTAPLRVVLEATAVVPEATAVVVATAAAAAAAATVVVATMATPVALVLSLLGGKQHNPPRTLAPHKVHPGASRPASLQHSTFLISGFLFFLYVTLVAQFCIWTTRRHHDLRRQMTASSQPAKAVFSPRAFTKHVIDCVSFDFGTLLA